MLKCGLNISRRGGGGGDIAPDQLWFDASDASTLLATAGALDQWNDKSGNGRHATASGSARPTTGSSTINGLNAVSFNGTANTMTLSSGVYGIPNGNNTIFLVSKLASTGATQCAISVSDAGTSRWRILPCDTVNTNISSSNSTANNIVATLATTLSTSAARTLFSVRTGAITQLGLEGVFGAQAAATSFTGTAARLGSFSSGAVQFMNGLICELRVYGRALSNTEINAIGAALNAKWGAAWSNFIEVPASLQGLTSVVGFGDSVTFGQGASSMPQQWLSIVGNNMRVAVTNKGIAGTVLQNSNAGGGSPLTNNGRDRYVADLTGAAKKDAVIINYGYNDLRYTGGGAMNLSNFSNDYQEVITGLLTVGYAANKIVLCSPYWSTDALYSSGSAGFTGSNRTVHEQYVAAVRALAVANGTLYADTYAYMRDNGGAALIGGDNIHPNDAGHAAIARSVLQATTVTA